MDGNYNKPLSSLPAVFLIVDVMGAINSPLPLQHLIKPTLNHNFPSTCHLAIYEGVVMNRTNRLIEGYTPTLEENAKILDQR